MRRRSGAAAARRALGVIALSGLAACSTRPKATANRGPFLSIVQSDGGPAARRAMAPGAVALALAGLPPEELAHLARHLAESPDTALRRAAAALLDLGDTVDGAASESLRQALPDLPALTAAANLLGSPWEAQGISVKVGPVCDAAASRCVPLFAAVQGASDSPVRRAHGLAWALSHAALLRVATNARAAVLEALRESQPRPSSTIAMVFATTRGTLDEPALERLRQLARRAVDDLASDAPQRPWLQALASAHAEWELPVPLEADQLLVVPRLSALARLPEFVSELERAGTFEWAFRPGAPTPPDAR